MGGKYTRKRLLLVAVAVGSVAIGGGAYGASLGMSSVPQKIVRLFTLSPGQSAVVAHEGALTFTAACNNDGSAEYDATTTMAHSELDFGPQIRDWGPGTDTAWGTEDQFEGNKGNGAMIAPDGSAILSSAIILSGTDNASFFGKCVFGGMISTEKGK